MSLDKQKILNELGSVVNQLQSADCGCMSRLFNDGHNQSNGAGYGCHGGHFGWGHNPCAGEPHMASCVARCNPPKLIADTYNYYDQHVVKPAMEEVYNELKSITPQNTVPNHPLASQMGAAQKRMTNMIDPSNQESMMSASQQMGSMQVQRQVVDGMNPQGNAIGGIQGPHMNGLQAQPMNGIMAGQGQAIGGMVAGQLQSSALGHTTGQIMGQDLNGAMYTQNQAMSGDPGYNQGQPGLMAGYGQLSSGISGGRPIHTMGNMMSGQGQIKSEMIAGQGNVMPGQDPAQSMSNGHVMGNLMTEKSQAMNVMPAHLQGQTVGSMINGQSQGMGVMPGELTSQTVGGMMTGQGQVMGSMPNMMQTNYQQVPATLSPMSGQRPLDDHTAALKKFNEVFPGVMSGDLGFNPMEMAIQMNTETNKQQAINATKSAMMGSNNMLPGSQAPSPTMNQQQMNQQQMNQLQMNQRPMNLQQMNQQQMNPQQMNQQQMSQQQVHLQQMNQQQMNQQPLNQQSINQQPMNQQPMNQQPMNQQPMNQQPMNQQPMNQQPMNQQPMNQQQMNHQQMNHQQMPSMTNQHMPSMLNQQQVSPTMNQQQVYRPSTQQQMPPPFNQQQTLSVMHEQQMPSVIGHQQVDPLTNQMPQAMNQQPIHQQRMNEYQVNQLQMPGIVNQQIQPQPQQMPSGNETPSTTGANLRPPSDISAQQSLQSPQKMDPILPAGTETGFNTLGQPVEMVPGNIYRQYDTGLPQPIIGGGYGYSNVKSTISKTSLVGNRGSYKTPSRSHLQHLYNQYKGSQSYTQQNIRDPKYAGTASDGQLNVAVRGSPQNQNIPIERVGGDTAINNQVNQQIKGEHQGDNLQPNKVEQAMGQIGDVPTKLPKQEISPVNVPRPPATDLPKKCRNGLQDMTYTSYSLGASWTFHGSPPPRVFRPNNLLSLK